MAVNTRDRRASAAAGEWDYLYPNPSGDLDTAVQRAHMAGLYAMVAVVALDEPRIVSVTGSVGLTAAVTGSTGLTTALTGSDGLTVTATGGIEI
jgi:hypothetical protein